jgi:nucleoid-associated protein YgaU
MATSRYAFTERIDGTRVGTSTLSSRIYLAAQNGQIGYNDSRLVRQQRLDHVAHVTYGDSTLWWVIAAASGIGWGLQCPPGTVIRIPTDLNQIYALMR